MGNILKEMKFLVLVVKIEKISKIWDSHFVDRSILSRLAFLIASYLKTEHSISLQTFAVFWPKMMNPNVTKV